MSLIGPVCDDLLQLKQKVHSWLINDGIIGPSHMCVDVSPYKLQIYCFLSSGTSLHTIKLYWSSNNSSSLKLSWVHETKEQSMPQIEMFIYRMCWFSFESKFDAILDISCTYLVGCPF